ncbi:MAG: succinate dehydrogenase, hydrophobic membrane anchor protein [Pseudomonadota bacterium]
MLIQLLTNKYPGMRLWLSQRLTAVVMAIYIVLLLIAVLIIQPVDYVAWYAFVSPIWFRLATLLFFMCLFMHAWLGVADVLKDYVFNKPLRAYLQMVVDVALMLYLFWIIYILWNV